MKGKKKNFHNWQLSNVNQDRIHKDMNLQYCNYTLVVLFIPFNEKNRKNSYKKNLYLYIYILFPLEEDFLTKDF